MGQSSAVSVTKMCMMQQQVCGDSPNGVAIRVTDHGCHCYNCLMRCSSQGFFVASQNQGTTFFQHQRLKDSYVVLHMAGSVVGLLTACNTCCVAVGHLYSGESGRHSLQIFYGTCPCLSFFGQVPVVPGQEYLLQPDTAGLIAVHRH